MPLPPRRPLVLPLVAALAAAALLGACGDDDDDAAPAPAPASDSSGDEAGDDDGGGGAPEEEEGDGGAGGDVASGEAVVTAAGFSFTDATVAPGAQVRFVNEDDAPHTLTADDDAFDSGTVEGGSQGSITAPDEPGTYAFHCEIHPDMSGTLTVEG